MKKIFLLLAVSLAVVTVLSGCSDDAYTPKAATIRVVKADTFFPSKGGEGTIEVESKGEFIVDPSAPWIEVGKSDNVVRIAIKSYAGIDSRSGEVRIYSNTGEVRVPITQQGAVISATPASLFFTQDQGTQVITVSSSMPYTVSKEGDWLTFDQNGDELTIVAQANSGSKREGKIVLTADRTGTPTVVTIPVTQNRTLTDDLVGTWNVTHVKWISAIGSWLGPIKNDHQMEISKVDATTIKISGIITPGKDDIIATVNISAKTITIATQKITPTWIPGYDTYLCPMVSGTFATGFPNNKYVLSITKNAANKYVVTITDGYQSVFNHHSWLIGVADDGDFAGATAYFANEKWVKVNPATLP